MEKQGLLGTLQLEHVEGLTVAQGGYQKWVVVTKHTDLVGGMVQHHTTVFPHSSAAPRAGAAGAGAASQHTCPTCLRGGICNSLTQFHKSSSGPSREVIET